MFYNLLKLKEKPLSTQNQAAATQRTTGARRIANSGGNYFVQTPDGKTQVEFSSIGGSVERFQANNRHILAPARRKGDKIRGGSHACAPWFGEQKEFGTEKHGHLRNFEMSAVPGRHRIEFSAVHLGNAEYPWSLRYTMHASVFPSMLIMELTALRMPDKNPNPAPVLLGFHPYFACSDARDVSVELSEGRRINFGDADGPFIIPAETRKPRIIMPTHDIAMTLSGDFEDETVVLALWTDDATSYLCVEPLLYDPVLFNTRDGLTLPQNVATRITMELKVVPKS